MSDRDAFLRASGANVLGNILKIVVEGWLGLMFGSLALVADAAHSAADLLASATVLIWGRLTFHGPDDDHPHGHDRIEPLTALIVAVALFVLAGKLFYDSIASIQSGSQVTFSLALVAGLVGAILLKLGLYWYTVRVNRAVDSPGLRALAVDCLNDVYASVAALAGVVGVAVGYPILDPVAGLLMTGLITYQAADIARENLSYLTGEAPTTTKRDEIRMVIHDHPAVEGIHEFRAYYIGPEIEVEFHAEVDGEYTLREAHTIETELVQSVEAIERVGETHVHLDPSGIGEWETADDDIEPLVNDA